MHDHIALVFASFLIFSYGLFSHLAERSPITAPMFFLSVGLLVSPIGLGIFHVEVDTEMVQVIAEITLVMILFVDASMIDVKQLKQGSKIPIRLLGIGLPLTMLLGVLIAYPLFPEMEIWVILLMALILSPTDAALGQAVITSKKVPEKVRRWISVESGMNDGIALPPILFCLAMLSVEGNGGGWGIYMLKQLILGPLIGGLVGWYGGLLVDKMSARRWMSPTFQRLVAFSLAILCYSSAELVHGNGFIAAFAGGLMLGTRTHAVRERIQEFGEAEGQQLALFVFLIFAMVMVPSAYPYWDLQAWIYAILSLTLIRMGPVILSLTGSGTDMATKFFVGWFGPRGIASVLYLLIVVGEIGVEGYERMLSVIVLTVMLSIFLHGISAVPLSAIYGKKQTGNN